MFLLTLAGGVEDDPLEAPRHGDPVPGAPDAVHTGGDPGPPL